MPLCGAPGKDSLTFNQSHVSNGENEVCKQYQFMIETRNKDKYEMEESHSEAMFVHGKLSTPS